MDFPIPSEILVVDGSEFETNQMIRVGDVSFGELHTLHECDDPEHEHEEDPAFLPIVVITPWASPGEQTPDTIKLILFPEDAAILLMGLAAVMARLTRIEKDKHDRD